MLKVEPEAKGSNLSSFIMRHSSEWYSIEVSFLRRLFPLNLVKEIIIRMANLVFARHCEDASNSQNKPLRKIVLSYLFYS